MGIGSFHYDGDTRGANVGFGDGRVQFFLNKTDSKTLRSMLTFNAEAVE
jgi:prepilin-type processing-associated H-X9-DG protein